MKQNFSYVGDELTLFEAARCWNAYAENLIGKYISGNVLEVGAGLGIKAEYLWNDRVATWMALEPDPDLAKKCSIRKFNSEKPNYQVMSTTLGDLPLGGRYETVLYLDVLEHIENDMEEIRLAASRLRPGGFLVVLAPAHNYLFSEFDRSIGHFRRYDISSMTRLAPPGLRVESIRYADSVGFFASLANSLLLRQQQPTPGQIHFWDNWLVPLSTYVDPILRYKFGKSIIFVWRRVDGIFE